MKILYEKSFYKDLSQISDRIVKEKLIDIIHDFKKKIPQSCLHQYRLKRCPVIRIIIELELENIVLV